MPATNRGPRIPAGAATSMSSRYYLNAQQPAWAMLQTGLTVFALFIIARYCLRRLFLWWRGPVAVTLPSRVGSATAGVRAQDSPRWIMDEKSHEAATLGTTTTAVEPVTVGGAATYPQEQQVPRATKAKLKVNPDWRGGGASALSRQFVSRLPPAPPLTPPELSTAVFTLRDAPHQTDSFIHQPNPDYMSSTSFVSSQTGGPASPTIPRRRSYNRTVPIGIPMPQGSSLSDADSVDLAFSPSSYPPTSPLLPPPPPSVSRVDNPHPQGPREVGVKGEIISVLDGEGAGWTRHTRVYGGGVCLACAASGDGHGGFYGATVTPEEMR
ncbi:hypothetical protein JDV02_006983 [Purpureocillium takamizusanense]|uniref:Uncharacterized protein n=1 Tax=Purpureocillium takamizusanense TaxID=2060973 RepID=A0A9Q8QKK7_9HYPO|nr:uncharacterized protein JDV02_006983 [Purpureocillium takamizusanense]UNI20937.1 hypothetical protein JDV02_006983 [Purpureocillium takamizusanense]